MKHAFCPVALESDRNQLASEPTADSNLTIGNSIIFLHSAFVCSVLWCVLLGRHLMLQEEKPTGLLARIPKIYGNRWVFVRVEPPFAGMAYRDAP